MYQEEHVNIQPIQQFLNDPLVAPLYSFLLLAVADFLLGVYRSITTGTFDWQKLPGILNTAVLAKAIPLAVLGALAFTVTDSTARTALQAAYIGGAAAALAAELNAILGKITAGRVGSYSVPAKK